MHELWVASGELDVGLFADHEQLALEVICGGDGLRSPDEDLADHRFDRLDALAEARRVDRDVSPTENVLTFPHHGFFYGVFTGDPVGWVLRQEDESYAVFPWFREVDAVGGHLLTKEPIRNLEQHPCAVARKGISPNGASMCEIRQYGEALFDDPAALAPLDIRNEPDSA